MLGGLGINITICPLLRGSRTEGSLSSWTLLRPATQRPGYGLWCSVSTLISSLGTWTFMPHPHLLAYWLFSTGTIWISSSGEVPMAGCLGVNVGLLLPESHLHFTRPVFPVLFRQGRNSCAPFGAPPQWVSRICLRLPECWNVPWMVHLFQLRVRGMGGVELGTEEGWREVGVIQSPTLAIPNSRKQG